MSLEWLEHTAGVEEIRELAFRNWRALWVGHHVLLLPPVETLHQGWAFLQKAWTH